MAYPGDTSLVNAHSRRPTVRDRDLQSISFVRELLATAGDLREIQRVPDAGWKIPGAPSARGGPLTLHASCKRS